MKESVHDRSNTPVPLPSPGSSPKKTNAKFISKWLQRKQPHTSPAQDLDWRCQGEDLETNFDWREDPAHCPDRRRSSGHKTISSVSSGSTALSTSFTSDSDCSEARTPDSSRPSSQDYYSRTDPVGSLEAQTEDEEVLDVFPAIQGLSPKRRPFSPYEHHRSPLGTKEAQAPHESSDLPPRHASPSHATPLRPAYFAKRPVALPNSALSLRRTGSLSAFPSCNADRTRPSTPTLGSPQSTRKRPKSLVASTVKPSVSPHRILEGGQRRYGFI